MVSAPSQHYVMDRLTLGLEIAEDGKERGIAMRHQERTLSQPAPRWRVTFRCCRHESVGECADPGRERGRENDDTAALRAAIAKHRAYSSQRNLSRVRLD